MDAKAAEPREWGACSDAILGFFEGRCRAVGGRIHNLKWRGAWWVIFLCLGNVFEVVALP
jgi:hypothetical protein